MRTAARLGTNAFTVMLAFSAGAGFARCPVPINQQTADSFLQSPDGLLSYFPLGGAPLRNATRSYTTGSVRLRSTLLSLAARASARQKRAIADAFADAYFECRFDQPNLGGEIDRAARAAADDAFKRAYVNTLSDGETPPPGGAADDAPRERLSLSRLGLPGVRYVEKPLPLPGGSWLHN